MVYDTTSEKDIDYSEINEISLDTIPQEYTLSDVKDNIEQPDYETNFPTDTTDAAIEVEKSGADEAEVKDIEYDKVNSVDEYQPYLPSSESMYLPNTFKSIKKVSEVQTLNPITVLCSQEPDFMPNMYNIYFILVDRDKSLTDIDMSKNIQKANEESGRDYLYTPFTNRWSMIGTRIEGIDIPQTKQAVATFKYAGQTINKIVGKKEYATKVDLNIRLDQSMFILDAFHALNSDFWAAERKRLESGDEYYTGKDFYNILGLASRDESSKMKRLDVVVEYDADYFTYSRYHDLLGTIGFNNDTGSLLNTNKNYEPDERWLSKKGRVQRYVFHDCHFLGRTSSLNFNQNAEAMSATFPFVYKQLGHLTASGQY